jgi:hypothetical protein
LPPTDEKNAIPAQAAVSPPMNSVNVVPCAFVAAIIPLLRSTSGIEIYDSSGADHR